jgi:two-component system sensor histidine kinase UhpB
MGPSSRRPIAPRAGGGTQRIARELHDDFNQRLAAHAIAISNLILRVPQKDTALLQQLTRLQSEAIGLSDGIRLLSHQLHPMVRNPDRLSSVLRSCCNGFGEQTKLRIELHIENEIESMSPETALCCFRVVQEGLRNTHKHAGATEVRINLFFASSALHPTLTDNGIGMETERINTRRGSVSPA